MESEVHAVIAEAERKARAMLAADLISPWHIFAYLRDGRAEWTKPEISRAAEAIVARLVAEGAILGDVTRPPLSVRVWPDQESVVPQAVAWWNALDRDPAPGEFGYLDKPLPPPPLQANWRPRADSGTSAGLGEAGAPTSLDPVAQAIDDLWRELDGDIICPWDIFAALREVRDEWTDEGISRAAEAVLRGLMDKGAVFGDLAWLVHDFRPWPDQHDAVSRAVTAWQGLDRDPWIGDIGWIYLPGVSPPTER